MQNVVIPDLDNNKNIKHISALYLYHGVFNFLGRSGDVGSWVSYAPELDKGSGRCSSVAASNQPDVSKGAHHTDGQIGRPRHLCS